ncbi:methylated-DNA--[protein]-cysteine S-methyltransferase [Mesorhizobium sp. CAU 1732]|uniref:methylated-DNA--[protein]-cysteine S-methyltransferase n=1 Tax=Mesorhizobium sp. CAU 1732 TaxID=3140358 RepID=UPI00325FE833
MSTASGHHVFETRLGFFALAWSGAGLTHVALPEATHEAAMRHVAKWGFTSGDGDGTGSPLPDFVAETVERITRYAQGEPVDLAAMPLDLSGIDGFRRAIYAAALKLGFGDVVTYGELAERAGFPKMARETGQALGRNPMPLVVPCHRIVAAGGKIGGFSAPGGAVTKERLLAHEGVRVGPPEPAQATFAF